MEIFERCFPHYVVTAVFLAEYFSAPPYRQGDERKCRFDELLSLDNLPRACRVVFLSSHYVLHTQTFFRKSNPTAIIVKETATQTATLLVKKKTAPTSGTICRDSKVEFHPMFPVGVRFNLAL